LTIKTLFKEFYMNYIGVSELKKSKTMWEMLARDKELVLTRDGKPAAVILPITPEGLESTLKAIRRARFSETVSAIRGRGKPINPEEIEKEISLSRAARK
jgi:antitoxin (DNA-binding transcriptional repressor) of toxin-antitoxin stability system